MNFEGVILLILCTAAATVFARRMKVILGIIFKGKKDDNLVPLAEGMSNFFSLVVLQKKLLKEPVEGLMHVFIFYGFIVLTIGTLEMILGILFGGFDFSFLGALYSLLLLSQDVLSALVSLAVLYGISRRIITKPRRLQGSPEATKDAVIVLCIILFLMITLLLMNGARLSSDQEFNYFMPFAKITGLLLSTIFGNETLVVIDRVNLWLHLLGILGFLAFLPFSKHLHLVFAFPNVFFKFAEPCGALSRIEIDFENMDENTKFGKNDIEDFTQKQLLDAFTCVECGRCQAACPAFNTGKPLNPKKIVNDIKHYALHKSDDRDYASKTALIGDTIGHDELWSCTTCMACHEACPLGIIHVDKIVDMRRYLSMMESNFPAELNNLYKNLENNFNPWGYAVGKRGDWARENEVKILCESENSSVEYLYFVGCAASYDDRNKKIAVSLAHVLKKAGISFAILGQEERCNGEAARRLGKEFLVNELVKDTLIKHNIDTINKYGITKIIASCPHCYNTLKNEFPRYHGNFQVTHYLTLVDDLLKTGRLKVDKEFAQSITYHDSCYLGRYNGIIDEPREIISRIKGSRFVDIGQSQWNSFCCGAGGGRMYLEENLGTRVNHTRIEQLKKSGCSTIATSCPFCQTMIEDGRREVDSGMNTSDLIEIIDQVSG